MILGIDVSTYLEELDDGAKYYDLKGQVIDPLDAFIANGVNYMRTRVWVNPYSEEGKPYLGGTCDLDNFIKLSKIGIDKGYKIILDLHYSDFWCDPAKQYIPKAWVGLSISELVDKVYEYTKATITEVLKENIPLDSIQIGNEITNGLLWPLGKLTDNGPGQERGNYENMISLLKAGIKACRELIPETKIIIHLERSGDHQVYKEFFTKLEEAKVDYDIIGASYYPYYHGSIEQVLGNLVKMKKLFNKPVMILELGYAFTLEDYVEGEKRQLVMNADFVKDPAHYVPKPISEEGQCEFIELLLKEAQEAGIDGVFYWEPLWIPGPHICWTSVEGQRYINEVGKETRNEWANQALFDYKGKVLKGFEAFKIKGERK